MKLQINILVNLRENLLKNEKKISKIFDMTFTCSYFFTTFTDSNTGRYKDKV